MAGIGSFGLVFDQAMWIDEVQDVLKEFSFRTHARSNTLRILFLDNISPEDAVLNLIDRNLVTEIKDG